MALAQQWCGPENGIEKFDHMWLVFEDFSSCDWCGESQTHDEMKEWTQKYGRQPLVRKAAGYREGGSE